MILLLPKSLVGMAALTDPGSYRYGVANVRVQDKGEGRWRVDATDGKSAAVVEGRNEPAEYPAFPAMETAPNSGTEGFVPAKDWQRAFKQLPKKAAPGADRVAAVLAADRVTLGTASGDGASWHAASLRPESTRWPAIDEAFPHVSTLAVKILVDGARLAELIGAAPVDSESIGVTLEVLQCGSAVPMLSVKAKDFAGFMFCQVNERKPETPAKVKVDAKRMATLLSLAAAHSGGVADSYAVLLEIHCEKGSRGDWSYPPVVVKTESGAQTFSGALMPLAL